MRPYAQTAEFENGKMLLPSRAVWLNDYIKELTKGGFGLIQSIDRVFNNGLIVEASRADHFTGSALSSLLQT